MCEMNYHQEIRESKRDTEMQQNNFSNLDIFDLLLGPKCSGNGNCYGDNFGSTSGKSFGHFRNRTASCGSIDGGLEHWEPGEVLEAGELDQSGSSAAFWDSNFDRQTVSEPGTPNKFYPVSTSYISFKFNIGHWQLSKMQEMLPVSLFYLNMSLRV